MITNLIIIIVIIIITTAGMNPMLMLDQEQMLKLESVLQSDEAKTFLGEVIKWIGCDGM